MRFASLPSFGPKAQQHTSPGQRPGLDVKGGPALKGRNRLGSPLQGWPSRDGKSQGVALGWHVSAPLVLPPFVAQSA